jgi:hypothetical protein
LDNVRVFGLNRLDSLELKKQFPDAQINFEPGATKDPQHGELATAAVIALTVAGIHALAAWMLKNRKGSVIEKTVEVVTPGGASRKETFYMEIKESTTQADVVKALAPKMGVDLSTLGGTKV